MPSGARSSANAEIVVQVRNPDGTAASTGIHLRLEAAGASVVDCTTDGAGRCRFVPGGAGKYTVRVKQFGYRESSLDIDFVDTMQTYVTLELKPDSGTALPESHPGIPVVSAADLAVPENAMPDAASPHALLGNILLREQDAQGALDEYHEYLRLEPFGSMAPAVRAVVEKLEKALHP